MKALAQPLEKLLADCLIFLLGAMALDVMWQIVTRFIINDPSTWTEELARFLLIWLGCLGAAYGVAQRFHLEMDYFLDKTSGARRELIDRIISAITLLLSLSVMVYGGGRLMWIANELNQVSPALNLPMSWVYAVLPISGVLMAYFALLQILHPVPHETEPEAID